MWSSTRCTRAQLAQQALLVRAARREREEEGRLDGDAALKLRHGRMQTVLHALFSESLNRRAMRYFGSTRRATEGR